jgi:hypothetical protein
MHAVEMGLGVMTYITSFIKIGSGIRKIIDIHRHRETHTRQHKSTLIFEKKESRQKTKYFMLFIADIWQFL